MRNFPKVADAAHVHACSGQRGCDRVFVPSNAGIDQRLGQDAADGEARIECVERILEDELRGSAERLELRALQGRKIVAVDRDAAGGRYPSFRSRRPVVVLPQPDSPSRPTKSLLVEREVDHIDRVYRGPSGRPHLAERAPHREMLGEALYIDEAAAMWRPPWARQQPLGTGKCFAWPVTSTRAAMWRPPWLSRATFRFGGAPAGDAMVRCDFVERRIVAAAREHKRATRGEATTRGRRAQIGRRAGYRNDLSDARPRSGNALVSPIV